jgi:hypothetical protein
MQHVAFDGQRHSLPTPDDRATPGDLASLACRGEKSASPASYGAKPMRRIGVLDSLGRDIRGPLPSRLVENEDAAFVRLPVEAFIRRPDGHKLRPEAIDLLARRLPGGPAFGRSADTNRHCRVGSDVERPGVWALRRRPNVADHESVPVSHVEQGSRSRLSRSTARCCQQQDRPLPHQGYSASG